MNTAYLRGYYQGYMAKHAEDDAATMNMLDHSLQDHEKRRTNVEGYKTLKTQADATKDKGPRGDARNIEYKRAQNSLLADTLSQGGEPEVTLKDRAKIMKNTLKGKSREDQHTNFFKSVWKHKDALPEGSNNKNILNNHLKTWSPWLKHYDTLRKVMGPDKALEGLPEGSIRDYIQSLIRDGVITAQNKRPATNTMVG